MRLSKYLNSTSRRCYKIGVNIRITVKNAVVVTRHDCLKLVKSVNSGRNSLEMLERFGHFSDLPQSFQPNISQLGSVLNKLQLKPW